MEWQNKFHDGLICFIESTCDNKVCSTQISFFMMQSQNQKVSSFKLIGKLFKDHSNNQRNKIWGSDRTHETSVFSGGFRVTLHYTTVNIKLTFLTLKLIKLNLTLYLIQCT